MGMNEIDSRNFRLIMIAGQIVERDALINNYQSNGFLDREIAIRHIAYLQSRDMYVVVTTRMRQELSNGTIPLIMYSNDQLIKELQWQDVVS